MIARVLLAVVLCGVTAGLAMGVMQHVRITPLILFAETFEKSHEHGATHSHDAGTPSAHEHPTETWMPADGMERTGLTYLTSVLSAVGFASVLAGVSLVFGQSITSQNGWIWGLCGFLAFSIGPAAGLPPEVPGMPVADLTMRQIWWVSTVVATGIGLWLLAFKRETWAIVVAFIILLLPHIVGAPVAPNHDSAVPAPIAADFTGSVLAANALMWLLIGTLLGRLLPRFNLDDNTCQQKSPQPSSPAF